MRISGVRGRVGGTQVTHLILDFPLRISNHHLGSTPNLPYRNTHISHICSSMEQGRGLGNGSMMLGQDHKSIKVSDQGELNRD
jgi:hypothetical protein